MATDGLEYLGPARSPASALATLSDPLRRWFQAAFGVPTAAQCLAWPALAAGSHLLLCAPTGSGKTLAAFAPLVGRLLAEPVCTTLRCLYVAPLKALVADARKNLRALVRGVRPYLPDGAEPVRLGVRTGDTAAAVRLRQRRRPPHVLLTTPETLAVLLSQPFSQEWFADLQAVVVDEVHALAPGKRGADLALSLERLDALTGGRLQRIGLSATCQPVQTAACFLVGVGRPCAIAQVADTAPLELTVEPLAETGGFLARLLERLEPELARNRTTLIFTNVRSLAERLGWALRRRHPEWDEQVAVHHSALAPARRRRVERRLKQGRLRAVVSSTSLELGIDIGSVDGVVLVHPPGSVVRLLQRVGRGGHAPQQSRRGLVLTANASELLEAAVTTASGRAAQVEPLRLPAPPLDVLCQQLLGMAAQAPCDTETAFALVRQAFPYRTLLRDDFDACLAYLSGRHREGEEWLPARLAWVGDTFAIRDGRTARLLRRNLGTILAAETRTVQLADGSAVGELDEPYADRLRPGDRFLLDGRCLECRTVAGGEVRVHEVIGRPAVPHWSGDGWPLAAGLARRLYLLRAQAAEALRDGATALARLLRADYGLDGPAVEALVDHFERQEAASEIPDATTCLVETVVDTSGLCIYVHTPLNRAGNDVLARLAVHRLARDRGRAVTSIVADLGFALVFRSGATLTPADLRTLLAVDGFDADLAAALADCATLRERFRRVALTGLMLLRNPLGPRRRVGGDDWAERRLFDQVVARAPDFVLLRQARREVEEECCDAAEAQAYLQRLPDLTLRVRHLPHPSPFAASWTQLAAGPVGGLDTPAEALRQLHASLMRDAHDAGTHGLASHP